MPGLKLPIHVSYLLFLSEFSSALALAYFRTALEVCRWTGTQPSLLLHPLDFLGCDDTTALSFFPAMQLRSSKKVSFVGRVLDLFRERFEIVPIERHAKHVSCLNLNRVAPDFAK